MYSRTPFLLLAAALILLVAADLAVGQGQAPIDVPTEGMIGRMLKEKIRLEPSRWHELPTVGQLRAQIAAQYDAEIKGEARLLMENGLVAGNDEPESEVHAAINPTDSMNFVVSAIKTSSGGDGQNPSLICPVYYTKDFGDNWHLSPFITLPGGREDVMATGGGDPVFAFDADGKAYFTWLYVFLTPRFDSLIMGMYWAYSDDGGATWITPENSAVIIGGGSLRASRMTIPDKQWLAVDRTASPWRNNLYVAFVELTNDTRLGRESSQIVLRKKLAGVDEFEDESISISGTGFEFVQFSSIDVDADGGIHVSFSGRLPGEELALWHSVSTDGGETFSEPNTISNIRFGGPTFGGLTDASAVIDGIVETRLYPCPHIAIDRNADEGGNIYAVWSGLGVDRNEGRGYDVLFSRSEDNGDTWSDPIVVNDNEADASDQFYPSISVSPEGVVVVTWYDKRESGPLDPTHYYLAQSFDGGLTFEKNVKVTSVPTSFSSIGELNGGFGIGEYTQVLTTSGYAIPFWADGRAGSGNMDIYTAIVPLAKTTNAPDRVGAVEGTVAALEVGPNPASGRIDVRFRLKSPSAVRIELVDETGKTVLVREFPSLEADQHTIPLDVEDITSGAYFVRVATAKGIAAQGITIAR